jgi:orotidine-5'-phosphate decarboxylase
LDNVSHGEALATVGELDNVSHFKLGVPLLFGGRLIELIRDIQTRRSRANVFVDLKFAADIEATFVSVMEQAAKHEVKFITLSEHPAPSVNRSVIAHAIAVREERGLDSPLLLMVPLVSSLAEPTLGRHGMTAEQYILERAAEMVDYGCDGIIVSGESIRSCRERFPEITILSPGIRPVGASADDHKRYTTPAQAIQYGADYLIVGRPIMNAEDKRQAASAIIQEIDEAASLERQKEVYRREKERLEQHHMGEWVIVQGEAVRGTFASFNETATFAVKKYGRGPYLIREIGFTGEVRLPASVMYRPEPASA